MSVHFLEEVCESMEILQVVVEMQPTVDHLGEIGHPLLLKYVWSQYDHTKVVLICNIQIHVDSPGLPLSLWCWLHRSRNGYVATCVFWPIIPRKSNWAILVRNVIFSMSFKSRYSSPRSSVLAPARMTKIFCSFLLFSPAPAVLIWNLGRLMALCLRIFMVKCRRPNLVAKSCKKRAISSISLTSFDSMPLRVTILNSS